jgi:hypothetical protein
VKKKARITTTDAEIDEAIALAKRWEQYRPKAVAAEYRPRPDIVAVKLASGVELLIPRKLLQGLENATPAQAAQVEVVGPGTGLHWEALDVDHYVPGLVEGVLGTRRWMSEIGKLGGVVRSKAKQQAARRNGRKGGRPRKRSAA